jgi:predicted nuclease of predicted toxin-antitoxin system
VKLLFDMNLSPRWVTAAVAEGFDAIHWSSVGPAPAPDPVILAFARDNGFVVVTNDLDFSAILAASGGAAPSVVQVRGGDLAPETQGATIFAALRRCAEALRSGAVISVEGAAARVRRLPIA